MKGFYSEEPFRKSSLSKESKQRENVKIQQENLALIRRIRERGPVYSVKEWEGAYIQKEALLKNICKYPYQPRIQQQPPASQTQSLGGRGDSQHSPQSGSPSRASNTQLLTSSSRGTGGKGRSAPAGQGASAGAGAQTTDDTANKSSCVYSQRGIRIGGVQSTLSVYERLKPFRLDFVARDDAGRSNLRPVSIPFRDLRHIFADEPDLLAPDNTEALVASVVPALWWFEQGPAFVLQLSPEAIVTPKKAAQTAEEQARAEAEGTEIVTMQFQLACINLPISQRLSKTDAAVFVWQHREDRFEYLDRTECVLSSRSPAFQKIVQITVPGAVLRAQVVQAAKAKAEADKEAAGSPPMSPRQGLGSPSSSATESKGDENPVLRLDVCDMDQGFAQEVLCSVDVSLLQLVTLFSSVNGLAPESQQDDNDNSQAQPASASSSSSSSASGVLTVALMLPTAPSSSQDAQQQESQAKAAARSSGAHLTITALPKEPARLGASRVSPKARLDQSGREAGSDATSNSSSTSASSSSSLSDGSISTSDHPNVMTGGQIGASDPSVINNRLSATTAAAAAAHKSYSNDNIHINVAASAQATSSSSSPSFLTVRASIRDLPPAVRAAHLCVWHVIPPQASTDPRGVSADPVRAAVYAAVYAALAQLTDRGASVSAKALSLSSYPLVYQSREPLAFSIHADFANVQLPYSVLIQGNGNSNSSGSGNGSSGSGSAFSGIMAAAVTAAVSTSTSTSTSPSYLVFGVTASKPNGAASTATSASASADLIAFAVIKTSQLASFLPPPSAASHARFQSMSIPIALRDPFTGDALAGSATSSASARGSSDPIGAAPSSLLYITDTVSAPVPVPPTAVGRPLGTPASRASPSFALSISCTGLGAGTNPLVTLYSRDVGDSKDHRGPHHVTSTSTSSSSSSSSSKGEVVLIGQTEVAQGPAPTFLRYIHVPHNVAASLLTSPLSSSSTSLSSVTSSVQFLFYVYDQKSPDAVRAEDLIGSCCVSSSTLFAEAAKALAKTTSSPRSQSVPSDCAIPSTSVTLDLLQQGDVAASTAAVVPGATLTATLSSIPPSALGLRISSSDLPRNKLFLAAVYAPNSEATAGVECVGQTDVASGPIANFARIVAVEPNHVDNETITVGVYETDKDGNPSVLLGQGGLSQSSVLGSSSDRPVSVELFESARSTGNEDEDEDEDVRDVVAHVTVERVPLPVQHYRVAIQLSRLGLQSNDAALKTHPALQAGLSAGAIEVLASLYQRPVGRTRAAQTYVGETERKVVAFSSTHSSNMPKVSFERDIAMSAHEDRDLVLMLYTAPSSIDVPPRPQEDCIGQATVALSALIASPQYLPIKLAQGRGVESVIGHALLSVSAW